MPAIEIIVAKAGARLWQKLVIERLRAAGHEIAVVHGPGEKWPLAMRAAVELERRVFRRAGPGLASPVDIEEAPSRGPAALRLDLTGAAPDGDAPTLRLAFGGSFSDSAVLAATAAGRLPDIEAVLDGKIVERAAPMIDKRESAVLGAEDVLARAATLAVAVASRITNGAHEGVPGGTGGDENTPTPNPSPQGGAGLRGDVARSQHLTILAENATTASPFPPLAHLWGGDRGGSG